MGQTFSRLRAVARQPEETPGSDYSLTSYCQMNEPPEKNGFFCHFNTQTRFHVLNYLAELPASRFVKAGSFADSEEGGNQSSHLIRCKEANKYFFHKY